MQRVVVYLLECREAAIFESRPYINCDFCQAGVVGASGGMYQAFTTGFACRLRLSDDSLLCLVVALSC